MKTKILVAFLVIIGAILLINSVSAVTINPGGSYGTPLPSEKYQISQLVDILVSIVRWIYIIFFIVAGMMILFAAFTYLTAGGDEEKIKNAKNQIIYAVVAIIVALLAFSLDRIVATFVAAG